jgi:hypothetical protein
MTNEEHELYGFQIERAHYWRDAYLAYRSFHEQKEFTRRLRSSGWLDYMLLSQQKRHMNKCIDNALKLEHRYLEIQYPDFKGDN